MPTSPQEDRVEGGDWPVVVIYANGKIPDRSAFDTVEYVDAPEQTYYPASAPNVLSPEEAARVAHHLPPDHDLWERLFDYAQKEEGS